MSHGSIHQCERQTVPQARGEPPMRLLPALLPPAWPRPFYHRRLGFFQLLQPVTMTVRAWTSRTQAGAGRPGSALAGVASVALSLTQHLGVLCCPAGAFPTRRPPPLGPRCHQAAGCPVPPSCWLQSLLVGGPGSLSLLCWSEAGSEVGWVGAQGPRPRPWHTRPPGAGPH